MKISMAELLKLISRDEDRARMRELSERYRAARAENVLDEVMHEIEQRWRAIRRPMPTREEVREMLEGGQDQS